MQAPTHFIPDGDVVERGRYTPDLGAESACGSLRPTPLRRPSFKALHGHGRLGSHDSTRGLSPECALTPSVFASGPAVASAPCASSSSSSSSSSESEEEEEAEDATDFSFAALAHARTLQRRRYAAHPPSAVPGVRGALLPVVRMLGCVVAVAVLAGSGRWTYAVHPGFV
ncbi:hypothetical protein B0H15DRAFT_806788 [Mycena belliarum]|uniref:Uncharacterized protein n=1 Tax=Mycena belliarum TaxID=1033014 RepID=A0AAD6XEI3_9AGAR|nr:hypothetical protein B0H15DRAFT_806788 [Mycena belliae]